jgi:hypothetical protein
MVVMTGPSATPLSPRASNLLIGARTKQEELSACDHDGCDVPVIVEGAAGLAT